MTTRVQVRDFVILFKRNNNGLLFVTVTVVLVAASVVDVVRITATTTKSSFSEEIPTMTYLRKLLTPY